MQGRIQFKLNQIIFIILFSIGTGLFAQQIERVEPPFWWAGMQNQDLQLMVYGKDISNTRVTVNYPGLELLETVLVENPNYLFLNLRLKPEASAGTIVFNFHSGRKKPLELKYELHERAVGSAARKGFI